jgi:hypothetical protein
VEATSQLEKACGPGRDALKSFLLQLNQNYVLQVEPERFLLEDKCTVDLAEARHIEKVRNAFYDRFRMLVSKINLPYPALIQ